MSEEDIKFHYITPSITAKWSSSKITLETQVTDGKINLKGNLVVREKPKRADYILYINENNPIAVVEAKDNKHSVSYGLQQAITYGGNEKAEVKKHFPADLASSETADLFMSVIMYRLKENGRAAVILPDGFLFGTDNAKLAIKKKLLTEFNLHTVIRMPHSVFAPYTSITTNILFFDRMKQTEGTWFYRLDMPEGYKNFSKTKPMKLEHFDTVVEWWNNRQEIS